MTTTPRDRVLAFLHARARVPGFSRFDRMASVYDATGERLNLTAADVTELVRRNDAIDHLFAARPDTPCRTTHRATGPGHEEHITCVEVPIYDLMAALQWSPNTVKE